MVIQFTIIALFTSISTSLTSGTQSASVLEQTDEPALANAADASSSPPHAGFLSCIT